MRSYVTDIEVIYQHRTEHAVCVRSHEDSEDTLLPLAQVEIEAPDGMVRGRVVTITAPQAVLEEKGLV